jgi:hypothetical protein
MSGPVTHPSHYNQGSIEVIDFILDQTLDFYRGNIVKYLARHRWKNGKQDLEKTLFYLNYLYENQSKIPRVRLDPQIHSEDFCKDQKLGFEESELIDIIVEQDSTHLEYAIPLIKTLINGYDTNK